MSVPLLVVEDLEVRHGAVTAVHDLSLEVDRGEIVGLIGPNGAGKSSTLHAIMGAVRASAGDVRVRGESVVGKRPEAVARKGVALVPEGRRIFADLTVDENLKLGLAGRRTRDGSDDDLARVYDLFPAVEESLRRKAGTLSGGQQQQLAIARALVADPEVLLLDEQHREPTVPDRRERLEDDVDHSRGQAERGLVEQQDLGVGHESPRNRKLLLLTARERTGLPFE